MRYAHATRTAISYQLSAISYQLMRYLPASFAQRGHSRSVANGQGQSLCHARYLRCF
ncbi:hypothetical protein [Moorena sp. SIO3A2]|uniref:hypothetical protein n=1 Tax=Moorena sp. SIO3A2 TaxID=2607841 RepID=UPI00257A6DB9|nr:hypothetical protein [Moorena sp. SIO3A2]